MSYFTGTAASLTALHTALLTHAQTDGWVLTGDVLSKAGVFFQIGVTATHITCLGCESDVVANPAPNSVSIGRIFERTGYPTQEISFPCNYEVFGFSQEIYLVANYNVSAYQWMAFGKSTVPGLVGPGGWCGATVGLFSINGSAVGPIGINLDGTISCAFGYDLHQSSAALFWASNRATNTETACGTAVKNCWVNSGLDGDGWKFAATDPGPIPGIRHAATLIGILPNAWNSETILLPIRAIKQRPSFKVSLVADLANARHLRIDNLAPGDILTFGADKWKVYPWHRKNLAARNGGNQISHTGTFGWAIRYEGP